MIRWNRLVVACAALFLVAACGDGGSSPLAPEAEVRRSGGYSVGANDTPPDSTTSIQSTTSSDPLLAEPQEPEENQRGGGYSVGSN